MGITLGRGLEAEAKKALEPVGADSSGKRFTYSNATYVLAVNGSPEGGTYCGSFVGEDDTTYNVYLLTEE